MSFTAFSRLRNNRLLSATARLAVQAALVVQQGRLALLVNVEVVLLALQVTVVCLPRATVVERRILAGKVVTFVPVTDVGPAALRQGARAGGKLGGDDSVGLDPVGKGIFAVLDDGLASLIAIVGSAGLAGSDGSVVDKLEEVLAVAGNNGDLLAVLTQGIKLVGVGSLDLLASDVGELSLGDERLGLSTDKLLLQDDNLGGVGLLVLELSNLVGDLLLACAKLVIGRNKGSSVAALLTVAAGLDGSLNVANALHGDAVLVVTVDVLVLELTNLVEKDTELVGDVRDILVSALSPDGQLLLWRCQRQDLQAGVESPTATSMRSLATVSKLRMTFFSIFTSCESFLARSGPKAPPALRRRAWPRDCQHLH
jgi:hypothetical protein